MENQEEVPLSRSPVDFFVKPEQISGPFFDPYTINFPVSEAVPSGIPVSISGTRYVFSVILEHAQEYASQRSSSSKRILAVFTAALLIFSLRYPCLHGWYGWYR